MAAVVSGGSTSINGRALRISSAVHSGLSSSGRLTFFRIGPLFAPIGSPQAVDSNVLAAWSDDGCIQSTTDQTKHAQAKFSVIVPPVDNADRLLEMHVSEHLEPSPAFPNVLGALPRVKFDIPIISYIRLNRG